MELCGQEHFHCSCMLWEGHDGHSPHVCKCGAAWDENGLGVRWPRPERNEEKYEESAFTMPEAGALWRFDKSSARFVRSGDEGSAR